MTHDLVCLGHKISVHRPSGNFDLIEGTTPPNVSGPPPHYHTGYHELFVVLEGNMEFLVDGKLTTVATGESIDLPPNTLHTFNNAGSTPCRWLNIHSPKGFLAFFEEFGINAQENNAFERSIEGSVITGVMQKAPTYDMHIQLSQERP